MEALPNAHGLVAGIAAYRHLRPLPATVANDARDVHELLVDPSHGGYAPERVRLLIDAQATGPALRGGLRDLARSADGDSVVVVYLSGHGARIQDGPHAGQYLLPVDTRGSSASALAETAISGQELSEALRAIPGRKVLVVFDCCHAGGIGAPKSLDEPELQAGLSEPYYEALMAGRGRAILASSRGDELSFAVEDARNSVFTEHLLAGLRGGVASDDGLIRVFDLFEYLQPRVTAAEPRQHPVFKADLEDNFPVALYRGGLAGAVGTDQDGFRYDAYVSYVDREPDASVVWETLLPELERTGLRVAISGDVEQPGIARVVGIERGIKQSRRTVVVLSPAYIEDAMADFEAVLAQTIGIQEGTYRVLPVKIAPLDADQLPVRLGMLASVDLTHPRRADRELDRLMDALQGPLPARWRT